MEGERPKNLRTILLAYPKRITKKYVPPRYIPGQADSGVRPGAIRGEPKDNWRINQLASPNPRTKVEKYVPVEEVRGSGLSPGTLAGQCTSRSYDLSRPILRYLVNNKKMFSFLGPQFVKNMDKMISQSWNCIYNYYKKALLEIQKKKKKQKRIGKRPRSKKGAAKETGKGGKGGKDKGGKGGKGGAPSRPKTEKELQEEKEKHFAAWAAQAAKPKKIFLPPPPPPRKIADMDVIRARMTQLAEPKITTIKYIRPSIDPHYVDPLRVSEAARKCTATERVVELSKNPAWKLEKLPEIIPGSVKRGALKGPVPPRFAELAVPKKKAAEKDNDLKENPFMISPNALKYKPTARIQDLAKPIDR